MIEKGFKIRHLNNEHRWIKKPRIIGDRPTHVLTHEDATEYDTDIECGRALRNMGLTYRSWGVYRIVEEGK